MRFILFAGSTRGRQGADIASFFTERTGLANHMSRKQSHDGPSALPMNCRGYWSLAAYPKIPTPSGLQNASSGIGRAFLKHSRASGKWSRNLRKQTFSFWTILGRSMIRLSSECPSFISCSNDANTNGRLLPPMSARMTGRADSRDESQAASSETQRTSR